MHVLRRSIRAAAGVLILAALLVVVTHQRPLGRGKALCRPSPPWTGRIVGRSSIQRPATLWTCRTPARSSV